MSPSSSSYLHIKGIPIPRKIVFYAAMCPSSIIGQHCKWSQCSCPQKQCLPKVCWRLLMCRLGASNLGNTYCSPTNHTIHANMDSQDNIVRVHWGLGLLQVLHTQKYGSNTLVQNEECHELKTFLEYCLFCFSSWVCVMGSYFQGRWTN